MENSTIKATTACSLVVFFLMSCASGPRAIEATVREADTSFTVGDYKRAMDLYGELYTAHTDKAILKRYVKAYKQIQAAADQAFQRQDFAKAGNLYYVLITGVMMDKKFKGLMPSDRYYAARQITACSRSLTEIGLVKYREKKLDEAISIWRDILTFDPDNKTVTKAIETASRQLQQLKRIQ